MNHMRMLLIAYLARCMHTLGALSCNTHTLHAYFACTMFVDVDTDMYGVRGSFNRNDIPHRRQTDGHATWHLQPRHHTFDAKIN